MNLRKEVKMTNKYENSECVIERCGLDRRSFSVAPLKPLKLDHKVVVEDGKCEADVYCRFNFCVEKVAIYDAPDRFWEDGYCIFELEHNKCYLSSYADEAIKEGVVIFSKYPPEAWEFGFEDKYGGLAHCLSLYSIGDAVVDRVHEDLKAFFKNSKKLWPRKKSFEVYICKLFDVELYTERKKSVEE